MLMMGKHRSRDSLDWTVAESDISSLANTVDPAKQANGNRGAGTDGHANTKKATMADLWEDNWDDDVIESDFAHQLRQATYSPSFSLHLRSDK